MQQRLVAVFAVILAAGNTGALADEVPDLVFDPPVTDAPQGPPLPPMPHAEDVEPVYLDGTRMITVIPEEPMPAPPADLYVPLTDEQQLLPTIAEPTTR